MLHYDQIMQTCLNVVPRRVRRNRRRKTRVWSRVWSLVNSSHIFFLLGSSGTSVFKVPKKIDGTALRTSLVVSGTKLSGLKWRPQTHIHCLMTLGAGTVLKPSHSLITLNQKFLLSGLLGSSWKEVFADNFFV
jgi:hypothetical protein